MHLESERDEAGANLRRDAMIDVCGEHAERIGCHLEDGHFSGAPLLRHVKEPLDDGLLAPVTRRGLARIEGDDVRVQLPEGLADAALSVRVMYRNERSSAYEGCMAQTVRTKKVGRVIVLLTVGAALWGGASFLYALGQPYEQACGSFKCEMSCLISQGTLSGGKCIYGECSCIH
ncbi:hypothetical protein [Corallococcus exercitus]|uniref:hypothetical protein n=1 Tax=Corallococcus exercitus TaxID=2316736 RepID=UPI0011C3D673|nr:hypothetical protein [Corallococcus exercitus]